MIFERKAIEADQPAEIRKITAPISNDLRNYLRHRARVDGNLRYFEVPDTASKEDVDAVKSELKRVDVSIEVLESLGVCEMSSESVGA